MVIPGGSGAVLDLPSHALGQRREVKCFAHDPRLPHPVEGVKCAGVIPQHEHFVADPQRKTPAVQGKKTCGKCQPEKGDEKWDHFSGLSSSSTMKRE